MPVVQYGIERDIGASAGKTVHRRVNFARSYSSVPTVAVNISSQTPATCRAEAANVTTSYFDIYLYRDNTIDTDVSWLAVGR